MHIIMPAARAHILVSTDRPTVDSQFGWSVYIGNSEKQQAAKAANRPYKLNAWVHKDGKAFYDEYIDDLLRAAWELVEKHYPEMAKKMLAALPAAYRLAGTGFSKATVAWNNPVRSRARRMRAVHARCMRGAHPRDVCVCVARRRRSTLTTTTSA